MFLNVLSFSDHMHTHTHTKHIYLTAKSWKINNIMFLLVFFNITSELFFLLFEFILYFISFYFPTNLTFLKTIYMFIYLLANSHVLYMSALFHLINWNSLSYLLYSILNMKNNKLFSRAESLFLLCVSLILFLELYLPTLFLP